MVPKQKGVEDADDSAWSRLRPYLKPKYFTIASVFVFGLHVLKGVILVVGLVLMGSSHGMGYVLDVSLSLWLMGGSLSAGVVIVLLIQTVRIQVGRSYRLPRRFSWDTLPCLVAFLGQLPALYLPHLMESVALYFWIAVPAGAFLFWFVRRRGRLKRAPSPGVRGVLVATGLLGLTALSFRDWSDPAYVDTLYTKLAMSFIAVYFAFCALDLVSLFQSHYDSQICPPTSEEGEESARMIMEEWDLDAETRFLLWLRRRLFSRAGVVLLAVVLCAVLGGYGFWRYRSRGRQGPLRLVRAAAQGEMRKVRDLVEAGIAPNCTVEMRYFWAPGFYGAGDVTPLHAAVSQGELQAAEFLLEQGADVNAATTRGTVPLHRAVGHGKTMVELLIRHGADPDRKNHHGATPLHLAVGKAKKEIASLLIEAGASVSVRDEHGETPLHWASCRGYREMIEFLLQSGADVNAPSNMGLTPLHRAADGPTARLLIKRGAVVGARAYGIEETDLPSYCKEKAPLYAGAVPLHLKSWYGDVETASVLLEAGECVDVRNEVGKTPLHLASRGNERKTVAFLIEAGASVNSRDLNGWTPAHEAGEAGNFEVVMTLAESGADMNAQTETGLTPLHLALKHASPAVLKMMLSYGADPNISDDCGKTPVDIAREQGYEDVLPVLRGAE